MATRKGFVLAMLLVLTIGVGFVGWLYQSSAGLSRTADELDELNASRIHAAINELLRLSLVIQEGRDTDWNDEVRRKFEENLDFLFVRLDHMEGRLVGRKWETFTTASGLNNRSFEENGRRAAASLRELIATGDVLLISDDIDAEIVATDFVDRIETARLNTFQYLDHLERVKRDLISWKDAKIQKLSGIVICFLIMSSVGVAIGMNLLRSEVQTRQLRDKAEGRAWKLAYFDQVTGLSNRARFTEIVDEALSRSSNCAVILLDLDHFKDINDRHGHLVGDAVLKTVAERICVTSEGFEGTAARLGGDEFAVFVETDDLPTLRKLCSDLLAACLEPIVFDDLSLKAGFSVGLVTSTQLSISSETRLEDMMRAADFALYASKDAGRNCYTLYDADLEALFNVRRELVNAMPGAVANREFEVFLQPKFDLVTSETISFEALVRWRRGDEIKTPTEFITIAEETGMVVEIDRYILDRAVEIIGAWNARYHMSYSVSVNLSALHFRGEGDLNFIEETVTKHGFPPELLTLEITETVQLENWASVVKSLARLRAFGCRISIDDFGAGYSSLAYLRMIDADELKIDRELVREIETSEEAQFILDTVVELAEQFGLSVVVEGIETESQLKRLRQMGCRFGQGYFFAPPTPAEEALQTAINELRAAEKEVS